MSGKVTLTITTGPRTGTTFVFERHDTLLLGRKSDCQVCLPDDARISRHHFLLEVNPPEICLRDLGSLHGTYINGQKHGGRVKEAIPDENTIHAPGQITLRDGDEIKAGQTTFKVRIETAITPLRSVICMQCGDKMSVETGEGEEDDNLCPVCRAEAQDDPGACLLSLSQHSQPLIQIGMDISDYRIIERLGSGGMGVVYLARRIRDGKQVALKAMPSKVAVNERARQQFLREMEATRALSHPHIIPFLGSGVHHGIFYFLLEYCERGDVASLMENRGGRLTLAEAGPILLQTLQGLAYAHQQGFVHRDVKPRNILLRGKEGKWSARLSDLGLAKNFEQVGFGGLTMTGEKAGTYFFMPREQVTHLKDFKPAGDVWAMGATCYYILTGTLPRNHFETQHQLDVVLHGKTTPIRQRDPRIPIPVAEVIDRALADEPGKRYQHAGEMHAALQQALNRS